HQLRHGCTRSPCTCTGYFGHFRITAFVPRAWYRWRNFDGTRANTFVLWKWKPRTKALISSATFMNSFSSETHSWLNSTKIFFKGKVRLELRNLWR
ncbi:MAG: hypothetical protein ACKOYC_01180, partial [Bacteroidota bacterium]